MSDDFRSECHELYNLKVKLTTLEAAKGKQADIASTHIREQIKEFGPILIKKFNEIIETWPIEEQYKFIFTDEEMLPKKQRASK